MKYGAGATAGIAGSEAGEYKLDQVKDLYSIRRSHYVFRV